MIFFETSIVNYMVLKHQFFQSVVIYTVCKHRNGIDFSISCIAHHSQVPKPGSRNICSFACIAIYTVLKHTSCRLLVYNNNFMSSNPTHQNVGSRGRSSHRRRPAISCEHRSLANAWKAVRVDVTCAHTTYVCI